MHTDDAGVPAGRSRHGPQGPRIPRHHRRVPERANMSGQGASPRRTAHDGAAPVATSRDADPGPGGGSIHGALGTIRAHDEGPRRSWTARVLTLLAIIGPGLIVMVGDNDAGG